MADDSKKGKALRKYAFYSNMAITMGVLIALGVFGGRKLDIWLDKSPLFTIIGSLLGVFIAMYLMIKDVIRISNSDKNEQKDTH
ncbi:MAG: AtpZ/AtpI family protein [Bacteroidales bacterium]|nr:AtpZ/AtpI family protein [Bacteroidales bacterium]